MYQNHNKKSGFTIVELLISMSVVSFLMLAIALMLMQMTNMMNRGNSMRELNAAARTINRDFTQTFNSLNELDWQGSKQLADASQTDNYVLYRSPNGLGRGGALCTGDYTYLWSIGEVEVFRYTQPNSGKIRFIKIHDSGKQYCLPGGNLNVDKNNLVVDLLPESSEANLQIYSMLFHSGDSLHDVTSNQRAISISYVLGTGDTTRGGAKTVDESTQTCNNGAFSNTCVANRFDLLVRTLGRK